MEELPVAVLGATGLVGQHFVRMLDGHPYFKIAALAGSERSAGRPYADAVEWAAGGDLPAEAARMTVQPASAEAVAASGARVVFSALPASAAGAVEDALRSRGRAVFTNASARRGHPDVPVVVPEINPGHLAWAARRKRGGGFIVADSNCSVAGLALLLAPLRPFGIRSVAVTTLQAISGAGRRGLAAMDIAGNCLPFIRGEEEKMALEPGLILGSLGTDGVVPWPVPVRASCCRVPVREGHLLSVSVEFEGPVGRDAAAEALASFRGLPQELGLPSAPERPVIVRTEDDRPQPALDAWAGSPARARGMAVTAGRLRSRGRGLDLFGLVHNTVRGAAGMCLLTAELAARQGLLDG
ncbi:MAG TPA: aspartate-semialdehyde dehydrogenase [Candidatus Aminicenantes bacterium]|nr:aspartate-semialdehyde dehydrogenase [Candidatus Aminicenantes bacterium]